MPLQDEHTEHNDVYDDVAMTQYIPKPVVANAMYATCHPLLASQIESGVHVRK